MSIKTITPIVEILTPIEEIKSFEKRIERIGRVCYKSEDKITSCESFVRNIIKRGHESVLEHCSISFLLTVSRACSHQLVRHRIASYSQESQRYVNYEKQGEIRIILPNIEHLEEDLKAQWEIRYVFNEVLSLMKTHIPIFFEDIF